MIANSVTRWSRRIGLAAVATVAALPSWAATDGGGGGLPQLDVSTFPTQVFWLFVSFALLYFVMSKVAIWRSCESCLPSKVNLTG